MARIAKKEQTREAERITPELATMEPGGLRDWFLRVVGVLSPEEWVGTRKELLKGLEAAGVNLGASVFMLGISARDYRELTAPDIAMLMRYVRINAPNAMTALSRQLVELERRYREANAEPARRAA